MKSALLIQYFLSRWMISLFSKLESQQFSFSLSIQQPYFLKKSPLQLSPQQSLSKWVSPTPLNSQHTVWFLPTSHSYKPSFLSFLHDFHSLCLSFPPQCSLSHSFTNTYTPSSIISARQPYRTTQQCMESPKHSKLLYIYLHHSTHNILLHYYIYFLPLNSRPP